MMKKSIILTGLSILMAIHAHAGISTINIEEKTQKILKLSDQQINRLSITGGIVSTVIANPSKFNIQIDENLGQAFITLFHEIEEPEGLTVVTDSGFSQDFLVTSRKGEPEIVYLEEPDQPNDYKSPILDLKQFFKIFSRQDVEGFERRLLEQNETVEVGGLLPYVQSIHVYESPYEKIYVLEVKNHSRREIEIPSIESAQWMFCPVRTLKRNGETKIVVSRERT